MNIAFFKSRSFRTAAVVLTFVFLAAVGVFVFMMKREQDANAAILLEQKQQMEEERCAKLREDERVKNYNEFIKSEEGRLLYARDHYGYLYPWDIRYNDGE